MKSDASLDKMEVREAAKIYRKEKSRPLTEYQKRINEVAQEICVQNPTMLHMRGRLLEKAREKVDSTYSFKKGKSRSKKYLTSSSAPKRCKLNKEYREQRMKGLEDELQNIRERIEYKEKRRSHSEGIRNYKACEEITEEIGQLKKQKQELQAELTALQKRDKKSKWYKRMRTVNSSSISSEDEPGRGEPASTKSSEGEQRQVTSPSPIPPSDTSDVEQSDRAGCSKSISTPDDNLSDQHF